MAEGHRTVQKSMTVDEDQNDMEESGYLHPSLFAPPRPQPAAVQAQVSSRVSLPPPPPSMAEGLTVQKSMTVDEDQNDMEESGYLHPRGTYYPERHLES